MQSVRGTVLQCGRFGCVVRLEDGRFALLPSTDRGVDAVRRAAGRGRHPRFAFAVAGEEGTRPALMLTSADDVESEQSTPVASSLEDKIINYLRQTADWDPDGSAAQRAAMTQAPRADRLLPFEMRARRQYRDSPQKPRRTKR